MKARCIQNLNIDGAEFLAGTMYDLEIEVINDDTPIQGVTLARGTKHRHYRFCAMVICLIAGRPVPTRIPFYDHQYVELHPQDELGTYKLPFDTYFKALEEVKDVGVVGGEDLGVVGTKKKVDFHDRIIYPNFKPSFEDMEKWKHQVLNYPKPYKKLTIEVEMTYPACDIYDTKDTFEFVGENIMAWLNANLSDGDDRLKISHLRVTNDGNTLETK